MRILWKGPVAATTEMSLPTLLRPAAIMPLANLLVNVYATNRARPLLYAVEDFRQDEQRIRIAPISPSPEAQGEA